MEVITIGVAPAGVSDPQKKSRVWAFAFAWMHLHFCACPHVWEKIVAWQAFLFPLNFHFYFQVSL